MLWLSIFRDIDYQTLKRSCQIFQNLQKKIFPLFFPTIKLQSKKSHKIRKFNFLLDTAFAHPSSFKKLKNKANIKHVRHDHNLSRQTEDKDIYVIATKENRIIITQDDGFRKQAKKKGAGIFIIPSYLTNDEIDLMLVEYIAGKNPDDFLGKTTKI